MMLVAYDRHARGDHQHEQVLADDLEREQGRSESVDLGVEDLQGERTKAVTTSIPLTTTAARRQVFGMNMP